MPEAPGAAAAAAPASPAPGSTPGEVSHVSNTPRSAQNAWSPQTAGNPSPSMTDDGRSVANTPGADSVYPTSPSYRSTPGSAAPRARAGGRWSTANPNGTMFTPEQRGAVDGDGDGDGDGGPPGIDQFTDDHAFNAQNSTMVWGTTISLHESMTNAKQFLRDNPEIADTIDSELRDLLLPKRKQRAEAEPEAQE